MDHASSRGGVFNYLSKSLLPYGNRDYRCASPSGQWLPPHHPVALSSTLYLLFLRIARASLIDHEHGYNLHI
jgi:hypothetical protein